jgi:transketolase
MSTTQAAQVAKLGQMDQLCINTIRTLSTDAVQQAFGWERCVGDSARIIGRKTFGASAPLKELQGKFGFEPGRVVAAAKESVGRA